jgi:ATP-dependent Clp protease ATP-binding subunit ClpX
VKGVIGFSQNGVTREMTKGELLRKSSPEDLMAHGLIPELVGRLPVLVTVDPLDREALMRILVEPRNALVKQYQHLLGLDSVKLEFHESALGAAADLTLKRETGARGLRSIIESRLLDVMFEIPSRKDIRRVMIDANVINGECPPYIYDAAGKPLTWTGGEPSVQNPAA